jgi:hypothetical protein
LHLYSTDDAIAVHAGRLDSAANPLLRAFLGMSMDERWLNRSPEEMLATFPWFHGEGFELIVQDLVDLPQDAPIVVEGFRVLPPLVAPLLSQPGQAVWLIPSAEFRLAAFAERRTLHDIADKTSDPDRALARLLARDGMFTERVAEEARALDLKVIDVDVGDSIDELTQLVGRTLGLARPGTSPCTPRSNG